MQIKIIEPIKEYSKVFNSPDEFNLWYTKNKDEMDKMTTHKLNKLYKIEGYRITKIKNVLMLKKDSQTITSTNDKVAGLSSPTPTIEQLKDDLQSKTLSLESEITKIKDTINQIISYLNQHCCFVMDDS